MTVDGQVRRHTGCYKVQYAKWRKAVKTPDMAANFLNSILTPT